MDYLLGKNPGASLNTVQKRSFGNLLVYCKSKTLPRFHLLFR